MAELEAWAAGLAEMHALIGSRFARSEPRERVAGYLRGLLDATSAGRTLLDRELYLPQGSTRRPAWTGSTSRRATRA
ncbi:MAG: hypothetical protein ACXVHI_06405, partial [Frankiaceae bacterium]